MLYYIMRHPLHLFIRKEMRRYIPYVSPPWEDDGCDYDEAFDSYESHRENEAVEEYYEEKYGA